MIMSSEFTVLSWKTSHGSLGGLISTAEPNYAVYKFVNRPDDWLAYCGLDKIAKTGSKQAAQTICQNHYRTHLHNRGVRLREEFRFFASVVLIGFTVLAGAIVLAGWGS